MPKYRTNVCVLLNFFVSLFFLYNLSAEKLLSKSRVLVYPERWHLCTLPVVQHAEWAGEGNAEDEPLQDRRGSSVQPQGNFPHLTEFVHHGRHMYGVCLSLFVAHSQVNTTLWSRGPSRLWRKSLCLISIWQIMMTSEAAAGRWIMYLFPVAIAEYPDRFIAHITL